MNTHMVLAYNFKHWREHNTPRDIMLILRQFDQCVNGLTITDFETYQRLAVTLWYG